MRSTKNINYANRGMRFEEMINITNRNYRTRKLAYIIKFPTPWKVLFRPGTRIPTKAWCESKSFLDYVGIYKGKAIAFDAKETHELTRFPLSNIEEHQFDILKDWTEQGGTAFILIHFSKRQETYLFTYERLKNYWQKAKIGGRKSIPYTDVKLYGKEIKSSNLGLVDYLKAIEEVMKL